jgi:glycosyltransferase involved in cell wall biosynthesis
VKKEGMLFISNFHFERNGNGGQQRTYFLIKELAHYFDLFVMSPYTSQDEAVKGINATFIENEGVKTQKMLQRSMRGRIATKINTIIPELTNKPSNFIRDHSLRQLRQQLNAFEGKKKYEHADIIVFDTRRTVVNLDKKRWKKRILNAHNFDFEISQQRLLQQLELSNTDITDFQLKLNEIINIKKFEFDIDSYFDVIWTCSDSDIEKFKVYNPNTAVTFECLPNGSDTETRSMQTMANDYKKILFVGSLNYFPNTKGLQWFVETIFKQLPSDFHLTIVGKSPNTDDFRFIEFFDNINLVGEVDDVEPFYALHDVVIVPILEGSGTRLKILEAFSYGKLVLSTAKGIEGISANDGEHYIIFENYKDFDTKFVQNLESDRFESIRKQSRRLVETSYSWKSIVSEYSKKLYGA